MILEAEKMTPVVDITEPKLQKIIKSLRSFGPCSFATLTDEYGNYLQVGGGGVTCLIEKRDVLQQRHFRGYQSDKRRGCPDGTILTFGGGSVALLADEWFSSAQAVEIFVCFLNRESLPGYVLWREVNLIPVAG